MLQVKSHHALALASQRNAASRPTASVASATSVATAKSATAATTEEVTHQLSVNLVKNLLRLTVSNITYLRGLFPESVYADRNIDGLAVKVLRHGASKAADQLMEWVGGCFDALERRYLRKTVVGIFTNPDDPSSLVESYTFRFEYSSDGAVQTNLSLHQGERCVGTTATMREIKGATIKMLRTIIVLIQTLKQLPEERYITMTLYYYDEVTPLEYQPPCFKMTQAADQYEFEATPLNINVGELSTGFHRLKLSIKAMNGQFDLPQSDELQGAASTSDGDSPAHEHHFAQPQHPQPAATAARASPPVAPVVAQPHQQHARLEQLPLSPEISQQDGSNPAEALRPRVNLSLSKPKSVASSVASVAPAAPDAAILHQATTERASQAVPIPNGKLANLAVPSSSAAAQSASQHESPHPPQVDRAPADDLVRCPCGVSETDGRMINCDRCGYWQHGVCFGFREGRKLQLDSHLCDLCHGLAASDAPVHHRMCSASTPSTSDRKQLALLRRALSAFVNGKTRSFTLQGMSNRLGVPLRVCRELAQKMVEEGVVSTKDARLLNTSTFTVYRNLKARAVVDEYFGGAESVIAAAAIEAAQAGVTPTAASMATSPRAATDAVPPRVDVAAVLAGASARQKRAINAAILQQMDMTDSQDDGQDKEGRRKRTKTSVVDFPVRVD